MPTEIDIDSYYSNPLGYTRGLFAQTANSTIITNTAVETSLINGGVGIAKNVIIGESVTCASMFVSGNINVAGTLTVVNITSTNLNNGVIEVQAYPESNDVIGLKDLYVIFDVNASSSNINMLRDTIVSGEQISGVDFPVTSSYSNGKITR